MLLIFPRPIGRLALTFALSVPALAGVMLTALPGRAATFATAEAELTLFNFSHDPISAAAFTDSLTASQSEDDGAISDADAVALALAADADGNPTFFQNRTIASAAGEGLRYSAIGQSTAVVNGYDFLVSANDTFSFDFTGLFNIFARTDGLSTEQASAEGQIQIDLFGGAQPGAQSLIESLTLFGRSDRARRQTQFSLDYSDGFDASYARRPNGEFDGYFQRQFRNPTYLTLVESKYQIAQVSRDVPVQVPAPTLVPALGMIAIKLRRKHRSTRHDADTSTHCAAKSETSAA
jgi:hypothetical protein